MKMRLNILIGGKAGQGINKISEIVSRILSKQGYYTFNYRDYPSLIRGGHNFNILSVSDKRVGSFESKLDCIVAMDDNTISVHTCNLREDGFVIDFKGFVDLGLNLNIALAGALIRVFGFNKEIIVEEIKKEFDNDAVSAVEKGYDSQERKFDLRFSGNNITIMTGSQAVALGAVNSGINLYIAYPMTPATGVMHELAGKEVEKGLMVFQPENEIAVVNSALGASFAGAKVMIGSSGGGYDLMTEGLSMQGISEIPLTVYLAARPGPGSGVPTYSTQADLDIALRAGHGEFPRVVVAPGDPVECVEKTNEAMYLSEKFGLLSIVLSDKHLAESEFSGVGNVSKPLKFKIKRRLPGKGIVKRSSYEHDSFGNTTEDAFLVKKNAEDRILKYENVKKEIEGFEMIKIYGKKNSKNLIVGWGSTKGAILDAIDGLDVKFLQVLYIKPMSDLVKKELEKSREIVLVENNLTGQLGRVIREKTGFSIKNRILKYDSRPFASDVLRKEIKGRFGF